MRYTTSKYGRDGSFADIIKVYAGMCRCGELAIEGVIMVMDTSYNHACAISFKIYMGVAGC